MSSSSKNLLKTAISKEPVDYMVIAADVEGGKISTVDTSKSGVVQDLKTVFGDVEVTK